MPTLRAKWTLQAKPIIDVYKKEKKRLFIDLVIVVVVLETGLDDSVNILGAKAC